jgi:hypothetical protein
MNDQRLFGRWRVSPRDVDQSGDYSWEFTPFGELIYSILENGVVVSRILLTYRTQDGTLITDQPSAPCEECMDYTFDNGALIVAGSILLREQDEMPSDPQAILFGIGSTAVNHALDTAGSDGPFIPFLMIENGSTRTLNRLIADSPERARAGARKAAAEATSALALAYAYDGFVRIGSDRIDSVFVEVSHRRCPEALVLVQPYDSSHVPVVRVGGVLNQPCESWFAKAI